MSPWNPCSECWHGVQWILYNEGKRYPVVSDGDKYRAMIAREGGQKALEQWTALEKAIKPLQDGAASFPAAAIRNDIGDCPTKPPSTTIKSNSCSPGAGECVYLLKLHLESAENLQCLTGCFLLASGVSSCKKPCADRQFVA